MIRAGLMRKLASGLYTYLPFGLRALKKVEAIVRTEMNASGGLEFVFPILLPKELLDQTGRWKIFRKELFRLKDRHEHEFALGPTHEEAFSEWASQEIRSHRQLPITLYQINTKFRDEIRPRFGVMRSKEFVMKDAYSWHTDDTSLDETYRTMSETYQRIFRRCGLDFVHVKADSGAMGGSGSEEFMVKSNVGEEAIMIAPGSHYAANIETAQEDEAALTAPNAKHVVANLEKISTPTQKSIEEVCAFLKVDATQTIKSLVYDILIDGKRKTILVLIRGDLEVNETKLTNFVGRLIPTAEIFLSSEETVKRISGAPTGFVGPVGLKETIDIYADISLKGLENAVTGANEEAFHLKNVSLSRDAKITSWGEFYSAREGKPAPGGKENLQSFRGIEVGHIFKLGKKYTEAFKHQVLLADGKSTTPTMGCYGIGINRTLAAVIEQHHDASGITWPMAISPFQVLLLTMNVKDEKSMEVSQKLYGELTAAGIEVLWDERDERPGFKFKDADLIGIPLQITIGEKALAQNGVEWKERIGTEKILVPLTEASQKIISFVRAALTGF
jgi:prolyl-tRNA synthetase